MRKIALIAGLAAVAVVAAWAQAAKTPVNRKCPLKPTVRIDPMQTVTYKGKVIGLCCSDCTDKFKKNPESYMSAVKEDSHIPLEPSGLTDAKTAFEQGKSGPYLVAILFADKGAKTAGFIKLISDPKVCAEVEKCAYAKVEFKKDSDEAKLCKVTAAPAFVLLDPRGETPTVIKSITGGTGASIIKDIQDGIKKLEK